MKFAVHTLGCKVNQYETQAIETILRSRGHVMAQPGETADLVIVNTCAVTAESGRKSRQAVRRLMHENPGAVTAVCGCFSQLSPGEVSALGADIVYGSGDKLKLIEDMERLSREKKVVCVDDPFARREFERLPAGAVDGRTRAMLKVQDGCVNFCTYCVIPYTRGRVRSLPKEEAAAEARRLAAEGFRELVLTGIEIASYGRGLSDGSDLTDLVCAVAKAAPELRIRLGSLEPTVITERFCSELAALGNVCPHFHLSLQSGSDAVLKAMNRKYGTELFFEKTGLLRASFPNCALTADLIAGFPGETEEQHRETLSFIRRCAFASVHVFPYSRRPGTKAADMPGQLSRAEKARRAHEAQQIAGEMHRAFLESQKGRVLSVLFETPRGGMSVGHSGHYCEVAVHGANLISVVKNVEILTVDGEMLVGEVI